MPPLVLLAAAGLGAYAGYRLVRGALEKLESGAASHPTDDHEDRMPRDLGALEWDPTSGVYRPRK